MVAPGATRSVEPGIHNHEMQRWRTGCAKDVTAVVIDSGLAGLQPAPRNDGYAAFCFTSSSRSARRKILPTGVFGNSSRNSMNFGRL